MKAMKIPRGDIGAICVKLPLPPGCLPTLWQDDERFHGKLYVGLPGALRNL